MEPILLVHIIFLGLWGGLVLVEILFELQMFRDQIDERSIAKLHQLSDRFFELPILAVVVGSGWYLWHQTGYSSEFLPKLAFALGAVSANLICYVFVEQRASTAELIQMNSAVEKSSEKNIRMRVLSKRLFSTIIPGVALAVVALVIAVMS